MIPQQLARTKRSPYDVIGIMGDSVARGNSDAAGNTPNYNTVFQWDAGNANLRTITNTDLLEPVAASAFGSQWPQFGRTYYEQTKGRKPVFVDCAIGGSRWFEAGAGFSWWTNDSLYSNAVTKIQNCMGYVGVPRVAMIYIGLGVNDANPGSYTLDISYLTSLIDRVNTDFGTPRILITIPWKKSITTLSEYDRLITMTQFIKSLAFTYSNVELCASMNNFSGYESQSGAILFKVDNYHLTTIGNNLLGDKMARQAAIPVTQYNKFTRSIIGMLWNNTTVVRRQYIDTLITDLISASLFTELDELHIYGTSHGDSNDTVIDWAFIHSASQSVNPVYSPDGVTFNTTADQRVTGGWRSLFQDKSILASDFIAGVFNGINTTPAGTVGSLMGVRESAAGGIVLIRQTTGSAITVFAASVTGTTDATDTKFADNSHYAVARSAGNQILIKNATVVKTEAVAATAMSQSAIRGFAIGAYNVNGVISDEFSVTIKASYTAKYSTWNISTFQTIMDNFLALWLTNTP